MLFPGHRLRERRLPDHLRIKKSSRENPVGFFYAPGQDPVSLANRALVLTISLICLRYFPLKLIAEQVYLYVTHDGFVIPDAIENIEYGDADQL